MKNRRGSGLAARDEKSFPWIVTCYYGSGILGIERYKHSQPGDIAVETQHATESSAQMDFSASVSQPEIGLVVMIGPGSTTRWEEA